MDVHDPSTPLPRSPRLTFHPYRGSDRDFFVELFGSAEGMRFVGGPMSATAAGRLFDAFVGMTTHPRIHSGWKVTSFGDEIGHAALLNEGDALEVSVILHASQWGRGFGTEVASALREHVEHIGRAPAMATVDLDHRASRGMLESAGFLLREEGRDDDGAYAIYVASPRKSTP